MNKLIGKGMLANVKCARGMQDFISVGRLLMFLWTCVTRVEDTIDISEPGVQS